jgi:hypothetical protein
LSRLVNAENCFDLGQAGNVNSVAFVVCEGADPSRARLLDIELHQRATVEEVSSHLSAILDDSLGQRLSLNFDGRSTHTRALCAGLYLANQARLVQSALKTLIEIAGLQRFIGLISLIRLREKALKPALNFSLFLRWQVPNSLHYFFNRRHLSPLLLNLSDASILASSDGSRKAPSRL